MIDNVFSKRNEENKRMKTPNERNIIIKLEDLEEDRFYRVEDLESVLRGRHLNYSIYTIRDYETYKCLNYKCAKRYNDFVEKCEVCGGEVRAPLIPSPRTRGGGRGVGHRRYTASDIREIVGIFEQRTDIGLQRSHPKI